MPQADDLEDLSDAIDAATRSADLRFTASFQPLRARLSRAITDAKIKDDFDLVVALARRLNRLPGGPQSALGAPGPADVAASPTSLADLDETYARLWRESDRVRASAFAAIAARLEKRLEVAGSGSDAVRATALQALSERIPFAMVDCGNALAFAKVQTNAYDLAHGLAFTRLPVCLEFLVGPHAQDVHVGILGRAGQPTTEICIGGWFRHISVMRMAPGGESVASCDHQAESGASAVQTPGAPEPITDDDANGEAFGSTLPTMFRVVVRSTGITVLRLRKSVFVPFLSSDRLFNSPQAFAFKAVGVPYRILSISSSQPTSAAPFVPPPAPGEPATGF